MIATFRRQWRECLIEAWALGTFMVSACFFTIVFFFPGSPLSNFASDNGRRIILGLFMGLTAAGLIYSPWGKRSGAHFNPAVTLTYFRLGKMSGTLTFLYGVFQTAGGLIGVLSVAMLFPNAIKHPSVSYAVTQPGSAGVNAAFVAEILISFVMMLTILIVSNSPNQSRWTGWCAGALVALYAAFESPISGFGMNPARTLASAWPAHSYKSIWIYFIAPPLGMLSAAELYLRSGRRR